MILKDPSVGLKRSSKKEMLTSYLWLFGPLSIIIVLILLLLTHPIDFLTAGEYAYTVVLAQVVMTPLARYLLISSQMKQLQGRVLRGPSRNKVLIGLFHLKLLFQYGFLASIAFLLEALKTLSQSPGTLIQALGQLQSVVYDLVVLLFASVMVILPLWLLRRIQVSSVRKSEDQLFTNHFEVNYPEVEATINRKLAVEKVWGRVTRISDRIVLSKAGGYVESFSWRDVIGVAAVRTAS